LGVLYVALPSDEEVRAWLEELELPIDDRADGRMATDAEIRAAVAALAGYRAEYRDEDGITVVDISLIEQAQAGPWAVLAYPASEQGSEPHLTFRRAWPEVMVPLLHGLSTVTGPIVLVPDTGGDPLLIYAGADPQVLIASWSA
jgi:hypothetical protein